MITPTYRAQVNLLLRVLPYVAMEESLALKGGTAINLFMRNMPRLSVDIDLTYLPFHPRDVALKGISDALRRIKDRLAQAAPKISATLLAQGDDEESKLVCQSTDATIKVEVNTLIRGELWPARKIEVSQAAQDEFGKSAVALIASDPEIYGGKICAALDRQHPRDLFDIQQLLADQGITDEIRLGFLALLVCHTRPMREVLRPNFKDQRVVFANHFDGMAIVPYSYDDFEATRVRLVKEIHARITDREREFLIRFKSGEPDWSLLPINALQDYPGVRWKLTNIQKLMRDRAKHADQLDALRAALSR